MLRVTIVVACALVLLSASLVQGAAVPQKINYQAVLLDDAGDPVTDPVNLTFSIYNQENGGSPLWTQSLNGVQPDANGQFSVILGDAINPISHEVLTGGQLWLGIWVEGDAQEMSPRTEMVSSAYSFRVNTVDQAEAGTIYGSLTVEESASKLEDARVIVTCAAKAPETVEISPCDGVILKATNQTGAEVLLAEVNDIDQDALMTMTNPGTDAQAAYSATAAEFGTSVAKALQKKYVYGGAGFQHLGDNQVDVLGEWGQMAPGQTYIGMTDYSAKAKGAFIRIRPPSTDLAEVFSVENSVGDKTFQLESQPDVGASISFYSTAAKAAVKKATLATEGLAMFGASESEELLMIEEETPGVVSITGTDYSAKAAGAKFRITAPTAASNDVFTVETSTGDPTFQLQTDPSGVTSMSFENAAAKISDRLVINNDGIFFLNAAKSETLMTITSAGNLVGKGKISMGQNMNNEGSFSNVLGYNNRAYGDSCSVTGGYNNSAKGKAGAVAAGANNRVFGVRAFIGAGYNNVAGDSTSSLPDVLEKFNFVGAGENNQALGLYSTVCGGSMNTATGGGGFIGGGALNVSYNFGTIPGGRADTATGSYSMVPGGEGNKATGSRSFAAGRRAKALHSGSFVWADNTDADFASTAQNQFLIRADYVGIGTNSPAYKLDVNGDINVSGSYNVKKGGVNYTHPDYVFEPDYKLMPLDELRKYVAEKKSLPGVITAEEVKKNEGFKMDELLVQMLEKMEEQTLYILQLEERIAELEKNR